MRAVILAGGKGTRLRPYTVVLPKPLMPIGQYPILEVILRQLAHCGFKRITMAVNHQAEIIQAFFGDGSKWGVKIDYSLEDTPLSTMGPLKLIQDPPEDFLVMNGDILTDLNYREFFDYHVANRNIFTISSYRREIKTDYGVLEIDGDKLSGFREKPVINYEVSMGIYMVNRKILDYIPEGRPYGFDNLMLDLIASENRASVRKHEGYWLDIGRPDDYMQAIDEFESIKGKFLK
ncbi:MAG: NTP transferase domain-containing protein [Deltaproteobacteria bacterium]|nr:NTP transferase domain-containing protein [Deltaproteobacteria bacterium]